MKLGCILLASGFGRRFGGNKLLLQVEGDSLARRALAACPAELFARRAVTSRFPELLALGAASGWQPLLNTEAEEGVSAGIRLGMTAMEEMDGVLFAVCDQPWLTPRSVARLAQAFRQQPDRIVALSWQGRRGSPVLFPRDLFPALRALSGDTGGSAVIRQHPHRLITVEASSEKELLDIDTADDLNP